MYLSYADQQNNKNLSILLNFLIYIVTSQSKLGDLIMDSHLYSTLENTSISFEEIKMTGILHSFCRFQNIEGIFRR